MQEIEIYELGDLLPELYGETPRRISHQSAISYAGVPLTAGWFISADTPATKKMIDHYVTHLEEHASTLFVDSQEVSENTWLSSPERAILEEAEHMPKARSVKTLSRALDMPDNFEWERIGDLAKYLRYSEGLRRLASMSDAMSTWRHSIHRHLMDYVHSSENEEWIKMLCIGAKREHLTTGVVYEDFKHKVTWDTHPYQIFEDLMT